MYKYRLWAFVVTTMLLMLTQAVAAESLSILTCTVRGDSKLGQRVIDLSIVPSKPNERFINCLIIVSTWHRSYLVPESRIEFSPASFV